jgi:hypothetical protein
MSLDLSAIRAAIIATIKPVVDTKFVSLYPYFPNAPSLPCIGVRASSNYLTYHSTFDNGPGLGGQSLVYMELHVAESGDPEDAGAFVDSMLSTRSGASIIEALEADRSLGGVVDDCVCLTGHMRPIGEDGGLIVGVVRLQIMTPK